MKYIIKQKVLKLKPTYDIKSEDGEVLYKVKGAYQRETLDIFDSSDNSLAKIKTDLSVLNFLSLFLAFDFRKFHIEKDGKRLFSISRSLNIFTFKLNIHSEIGDISIIPTAGFSFDIQLNGEKIAEFTKKRFSIGDEYQLSVNDGHDQVVFLGIMIAIDRILFTQR